MEKRQILFPLMLCTLALIITVNAANAATARVATLDIRDSNGVKRVIFNLGETVYFNWTADGTVDIKVYFDYGTLSQQWLNQASSGQVSYIPPELGLYYVECTGLSTRRVLAVGTFDIIPEVPIGIVLTTLACFVAFGTLKIRRRK